MKVIRNRKLRTKEEIEAIMSQYFTQVKSGKMLHSQFARENKVPVSTLSGWSKLGVPTKTPIETKDSLQIISNYPSTKKAASRSLVSRVDKIKEAPSHNFVAVEVNGEVFLVDLTACTKIRKV